MKQITAIHVDDDPFSLNILSELLCNIPEFSLLKSFTNTEDAFKYLKTNSVDVLFSDIEMPRNDGFWLTEQVIDLNMKTVFVTSHSKYALNAFEISAFGYLVKPVQEDRLRLLIKRIHGKVEKRKVQKQNKEILNNDIDTTSYPKRIFIQTVGTLHLIILEEVIYFSASGAYTNVYFISGKEILSSKMLKNYADALKNHPDFVRTHRSFLVNKNYVKTLESNIGKFTLVMSNGDQLEGSQRRKEQILEDLMN